MSVRLSHYDIIVAPLRERRLAARERVKTFGAEDYELTLVNGLLAGSSSAAVELALDSIASLYAVVERVMNRVEDPYCFSQIAMDPDVARASGFLIRLCALQGEKSTANSLLTLVMFQVWQSLCFERAGSHLYETSQGLTQRLFHTQIDELMCDDIHLPHRALHLMVPESVPFSVYNDETGWHPLLGISLVEDANDPPIGDHRCRSWRVMIFGASKNNVAWDDAITYFSIPLPAGRTLNSVLADESTRTRKGLLTEESRLSFDRDWKTFTNWALNAVLYTMWPGAESRRYYGNPEAERLLERIAKHPKGSGKYLRAKMEFNSCNPMRRTLLGESIAPWSGYGDKELGGVHPGRWLTVKGKRVWARPLMDGQ